MLECVTRGTHLNQAEAEDSNTDEKVKYHNIVLKTVDTLTNSELNEIHDQ